MICDIAQEEMVLALYGELPAESLFELEVHMERCDACRAEWTHLEALHGSLRAFHAMPEPSPNLLAASRMQLDAALDASPSGSVLQRFLGHSLR